MSNGQISTRTIRRKVKIWNYGNGYVEVSTSLVGFQSEDRLSRQKVGDGESAPSESASENAERNTRRARQMIRRKLMGNGFDRLLTLTTRACIDEPDLAWALWARFLRLLRDRAGIRFPYVTVLEWQNRGAAHFHAALAGPQDIGLLRRFWLQAVADLVPASHPSLWREDVGSFAPNDGSLNIEYRSDTNPAKIAGYLSKYLAKQADLAEKGAKRYRCSLGLREPVETLEVSPDTNPAQVVENALLDAGSTAATILVGDEGTTAWGCSWDRRGNVGGLRANPAGSGPPPG